MNVNGIETQYQKFAAAGASSTKSSSSENVLDSFQKELVNWQIRTKQAIDKQQENDSNGNILMSEKKWRNLMKKVDHALDASKDKIREQEQQEQDKNLLKKDTVTVSSQTPKTDIQAFDPKLVLRSDYTAFLSASGKRERE